MNPISYFGLGIGKPSASEVGGTSVFESEGTLTLEGKVVFESKGISEL